ncbi:MAG TPA: hypothetical protein VIY72_07535 [Acidimicrobiales bacterium]
MGERVRIERHRDGRLVAVKTARSGHEPDLAREAEILARAQVPGVVELVDDAPAPDGDGAAEGTLVTRWIGPRSLGDIDASLDPERVAGVCLAVAASIGRLHRCGVVHGAIAPTHVVLDAHGRPVLCGFGAARLIDDTAGVRPADDVAGLGHLLSHLLVTGDDPAPSRRAARSQRRALLTLAAAATVEDPTCRPSLAAFVHGLRRAVPDARLAVGTPAQPSRSDRADREPAPARPGGDRSRVSEARAPRVSRPSDHRRRPGGSERSRPASPSPTARSALALAAVVIVGATTYFGLSAWWSGAEPGPAGAPAITSPDLSTSETRRSSASSTSTTRPSPTSSASATPPEASPTPTADPAAAPVVEHDGRRYEVGQPGDVALVGPWFCDGRAVVALLRPSAGSVHVFPEWAPAGGALEARSVASVPGATQLTQVADGPGCAVLVVGSPSGALRTLTAEDLR